MYGPLPDILKLMLEDLVLKQLVARQGIYKRETILYIPYNSNLLKDKNRGKGHFRVIYNFSDKQKKTELDSF